LLLLLKQLIFSQVHPILIYISLKSKDLTKFVLQQLIRNISIVNLCEHKVILKFVDILNSKLFHKASAPAVFWCVLDHNKECIPKNVEHGGSKNGPNPVGSRKKRGV